MMEDDLGEFLAPAGSALGKVTQRVLAYLSVQDIIEYVAVASSQPHNTSEVESPEDSVADHRGGDGSSCRGNGGVIGVRRIPSSASCRRRGAAEGNQSDFRRCGKTFSSRTGNRLSPEVEIPHTTDTESGHGGGDEAGGSSREAITQRIRDPRSSDVRKNVNDDEREGGRWREGSSLNQERRNHSFAPDSGLGIQVFAVEEDSVQGHRGTAEEEDNKRAERANRCKEKGKKGTNILGTLIGLGLKPLAAFGAIRNGLAHVFGGVPLLALLQWAAGTSSSIFGMTFRVALLPYDVTRGVVGYVMGAVEAMLNVAEEIWCELRHLNLGELAMVVSCVLSGNTLPEFLLNPLGGGPTAKDGSISKGADATLRILSNFSRRGSKGSTKGSTSGSNEGHGLAEDYFPVCSRSQGPSGSDGTTWRVGGDASDADVTWREAHAMRRRLDRVNRTASLVSYQEGSEIGVSRAKAQRVRRRMHYAMSVQCFQATVTKCGRDSPNSNGRRDDDELDDLDEDDFDATAEAGSREGSLICTPQSFPPTPNSRAHVMAHTSRFADDVIFLARDQLRLRENLKPGVDETTRATADFLRRQRRLAVLDGGSVGEGIVLTCGHHRATKIGPSLYSSARAMVPVLRNRHVYFQVSCDRDGPSGPSVGVGLSTPEMSLSTLVGAFSNSVGLCSTGQVLMSSRWYGVPGKYAVRKTGPSTVGVLVYLDDSRSFRSWDGDMVRALVCFSVDGRLVRITTAHAPPMQLPSLSSAATGASLARGCASLCYASAAEEVVPWEHAAAAAAEADAATTPYAPVIGVHGAHIGKGAIEGITGAGLPDSMPGVLALMQAGVSGTGRGDVLGRQGVTSPAPATVGEAAAAALGLALPDDRDLFPTVTIHSSNTEVLCRFCAEDLLPVSRESMGAPPGVPVYALDGSLINV